MTATYQTIVDYWMTDLTTNVAGLTSALRHKYGAWSPEELFTETVGERHVAIWPELDAETSEPLLTDGSRIATQTYAVLVWENASDTQGRLQDNDTANLAWLQLAEAIRDRFLRQASASSGDSEVMSTSYLGTNFQRSGTHRVLAIGFTCQVPLAAS